MSMPVNCPFCHRPAQPYISPAGIWKCEPCGVFFAPQPGHPGVPGRPPVLPQQKPEDAA